MVDYDQKKETEQVERIRTKEQLKEWLNIELRNSPKGIKAFLPTERAILGRYHKLLRKTEYCINTKKKLLSRYYQLRLNAMQSRYSLHIPANTCGKGLYIMHLGPILINHWASIGENCYLHINTAVVAGGTNDEAPKIGNNVVIGVGAAVVGGVSVADYTAIGANAVVVKDVVEENIAVAGVPAKKISNNGSKEWNKNGTKK